MSQHSSTSGTIFDGYKTNEGESLDPDNTLLVPHGMHPARLCPWFTERVTFYDLFGLSMDPAAAWDMVWQNGRGRGPWQGGTLYNFEISYAMGIRYDRVKIGDTTYWAPRSAVEAEMDSADEWERISKGPWANLPEHKYFAVMGQLGWIPKDYGEEHLIEKWKKASESESDDVKSDKDNEEPRELSPVEPGRMEERGFMSWTAGITVGEN